MQRSITRGAILRFELADELVEAGFVGDVGTGELQYALALQSMFERLLAHRALAADERALTAVASSVCVGRHGRGAAHSLGVAIR